MLGCQDFCGYYDWTFHHVQRELGDDAVKRLWAEAIGGESQLHYLQAALNKGLRGLYETWVQTGEDECCDWTFTLDEDRNVLRWDMRNCPSKGFLLGNNLNAHTDYCDHCMGWIIPLLAEAGVQVERHEHNHCGQCWAEMSIKGRPYAPLDLPNDIRKDPRWRHGYVDTWRQDSKQPFLQERSNAVEAGEVLADAFREVDRLIIVGPESAAPSIAPGAVILMTGGAYAAGLLPNEKVMAVLIDTPPIDLDRVAERFVRCATESRPLLLYSYLPNAIDVDFLSRGLPRPLPILPLLIRGGVYTHVPDQPPPSTEIFLSLMSKALNKSAAAVVTSPYSHHPR